MRSTTASTAARAFRPLVGHGSVLTGMPRLSDGPGRQDKSGFP
jgi:hypothetical protein